jgi:RNA polymerase sigma factor (sigma-70 family)
MAAATLSTVLHHLRSLTVDELSDQQLLERFAGTADEAAFAALVRRHGPLVHGVCRRVLGQGPDLDDAFQATFVVLARKAAGIRKQAAVASWLYGVAYRLALELKAQLGRRHRREAITSLEHLAETQPMRVDPSTRASLHELGAILDEELQRLPAASRDALVLCHLEGLSNSEAAQRLGWPLGTLKGRVQRARDVLRQRLQRRGVTLSAMALTVVLAEYSAAAVPAKLLRATVRCASPAAVPARVAVLAQGAAHVLAAGRMKLALISLLAVGLLGLAAGSASFPVAGAATEPAVTEPQSKEIPVVKDGFDESLPAGALARLGTLRWRHGGPVTMIALSRDGKTLVSSADDRLIHVWEYATGKELLRLGPGKIDLSALPPGTTGTISRNLVASAVAVASDGMLLATHFGLPEVQIWDTAGNKLQNIPLGKGNSDVGALAFAPDGKHLAVASVSGIIRLWDLKAEKFVRTMESLPKPGLDADMALQRLARALLMTAARGLMVYSPDGKTLAAALRDVEEGRSAAKMQFWDVQTGKLTHSLKIAGRPSIVAPVFSPDSKWFACAKTGGDVIVAEAATGKVLHEWRLAVTRGDPGLVFAADSSKLYTKELNGIVREWDVVTGKELRSLGIDEDKGSVLPTGGPRRCLALSADGKTLAVGGDGLGIRFIDVRSGKELPVPGGHANPISSIHYAADGKSLVTFGQDYTVRVWDAAAGKQLKQISTPGAVRMFATSPDGRFLAVEDMVNHFKLVDADSGKELVKLADPGGLTRSLFAPDSKSLAVRQAADNSLILYAVPSGKELWRHSPGVDGRRTNFTFVFAPDGRYLAVLSGTKDVVIHDAATGNPVQKFELGAIKFVRSMVFSPDNRALAIDTGRGLVHIIEIATGTERQRVGTPPEPAAPKAGLVVGGGTGGGSSVTLGQAGVAVVAFSPDSRMLAQGDRQSLVVWNLATAQALGRYEGHRAFIGAVAYAPDGRSVATGSGDTTALIWDVKGLADKSGPAAQALDAEALMARWADLTSDDAVAGFKAMNALVAAPQQALPLLRQKLQPTAGVEAARIAKLIDDLGNGEYKVRQKAQSELHQIGEIALPQLEKALGEKVPLETRQRLEALHAKLAKLALAGDRLRLARAVEILERLGTTEARAVLQTLADGAPGALATTHAAAALKRFP